MRGLSSIYLMIFTIFFYQCGSWDGTNGEKTQSATRDFLRQQETLLFQAVEQKNVEQLERLLSPDFISHQGNGNVLGKSQKIEQIMTPAEFQNKTGIDSVSVYLYGRILGIVTSVVAVNQNTLSTGESDKVAFARTHLWLKQHGTWQCIAEHLNKIQ